MAQYMDWHVYDYSLLCNIRVGYRYQQQANNSKGTVQEKNKAIGHTISLVQFVDYFV